MWQRTKIRVKCANCGMIYDIMVPNYLGTEDTMIRGKCPRCGSNAYDQITPDFTRWTYALKG